MDALARRLQRLGDPGWLATFIVQLLDTAHSGFALHALAPAQLRGVQLFGG